MTDPHATDPTDTQHTHDEQRFRLPLAHLASVAREWVASHTSALDRTEADIDPDDVRYLSLPDTSHEDIARLAELIGEITEVTTRLARRPELTPYAAQLTEAAVIIQQGELALDKVVMAMPGYGTDASTLDALRGAAVQWETGEDIQRRIAAWTVHCGTCQRPEAPDQQITIASCSECGYPFYYCEPCGPPDISQHRCEDECTPA
jgi:hypothetical protein